jgi:hypothetical protein
MKSSEGLQKNIRKNEKAPPAFIANNEELLGKYNASEICYNEFLVLMGKLGQFRRDEIPVETIKLWYIEIIRLGWTRDSLIKKINGMKNVKVYAKLDWTNFMEGEKLYTATEFEAEMKRRVLFAKSEMKRKEENSEGYRLTPEMMLAVMEDEITRLNTEMYEKRDQLIEEEKIRFKAKAKERKIQLNAFTIQQKMYIIEQLKSDDILKVETQAEYRFFIENMGVIWHLIPDTLFEAVSANINLN